MGGPHWHPRPASQAQAYAETLPGCLRSRGVLPKGLDRTVAPCNSTLASCTSYPAPPDPTLSLSVITGFFKLVATLGSAGTEAPSTREARSNNKRMSHDGSTTPPDCDAADSDTARRRLGPASPGQRAQAPHPAAHPGLPQPRPHPAHDPHHALLALPPPARLSPLAAPLPTSRSRPLTVVGSAPSVSPCPAPSSLGSACVVAAAAM